MHIFLLLLPAVRTPIGLAIMNFKCTVCIQNTSLKLQLFTQLVDETVKRVKRVVGDPLTHSPPACILTDNHFCTSPMLELWAQG